MKKEIEKIEKIESIKDLASYSKELNTRIIRNMVICGLLAILGLESFHYGNIEMQTVQNAENLYNAMLFAVGSSIAGVIWTGARTFKNILLKEKVDKKIRKLSGGE